MTRLHQWKSGTAALMAMAVTTTVISPLFSLAPANAQYSIKTELGNTETLPFLLELLFLSPTIKRQLLLLLGKVNL
jgi:hypothetical protein